MTLNISNVVNVLCANESTGTASITPIGGTPAYTYTWLPTGGSASTGTNLAQGNYTVTVSDINSCVNTTTLEITGVSQPLNISITDTIKPNCEGQNNGLITVDVTGGTPSYTYLWNNGITTPSNNNIGPSNYTVTVTDANSCTSQLVITLECYTEFFIPEIFSPNGDGKNDFFVIKGLQQYPNNKITIYNRWGNKVYEKEKYSNDWDGKPNVTTGTGSNVLASGTYYVVFDKGDGDKPYAGYVQLEY
jgi:gliding motility-associated-like protein